MITAAPGYKVNPDNPNQVIQNTQPGMAVDPNNPTQLTQQDITSALPGGTIVPNEPAVLSTVSGKQNFNNNIQPLIDKANEISQTAGKIKAERDANTAALAASKTTTTQLPQDVMDEINSASTDPTTKVTNDYLAKLDQDKTDATEKANNLTLAATQSAKASIDSLTNSWNDRKTLLIQSNKANEANWMQQFTRSGQAEYSPGMTGNLITDKEQEGQRAVKQLDDEYNAKVAEINAALDSKKFDIAAQKTSELSQIQDKAYTVMSANAKDAKDTNDKIRATAIQSTRDSTIGNLIAQGVTDPAKMLNYLNFKDDGTSSGGDFTAEEVSKAMKALTVEQKDPKALPADIATFEYIRDHYGLPDNIKALPPEQQYFGYLKQLKQAQTITKPETSGGYSAEELRKLRQAGIDSNDVKTADNFLYGQDNNGSATIPTFDEYVKAAEGITKMSLGPDAQAQLKEQYDKEYSQYKGNNTPEKFSATELKKLEQGNLLNASRKEQLDYLYSDSGAPALPPGLQ